MQGPIPSLHGLRAVAVAMVLLGHAARFPSFPAAIRELLFFDVAYFGVNVFFVLSGFLITTLLIEEHRRTGRISLKDFYVRRTLRIFPAAYVYIGVVALLAAAGYVGLERGDLLHALTYTTNYHHERARTLGHLWSLAVEEQFYLLWPLAFVLAGRARAPWVAGAIIALVPAVRVLSWMLFPERRVGINEEFQVVCDALATGCLLALLVARHGLAGLADRVPRWAYAAAVPVALAASALGNWPSFQLPIGMTLVNLSIAVTLLWLVAYPGTWAGRMLNSRIAVFIGILSYSLYLWQQLFLDPGLMPARFGMTIGLVLTVLAALASYALVERPLVALRHRFRR